jgi:hypothetical protein
MRPLLAVRRRCRQAFAAAAAAAASDFRPPLPLMFSRHDAFAMPPFSFHTAPPVSASPLILRFSRRCRAVDLPPLPPVAVISPPLSPLLLRHAVSVRLTGDADCQLRLRVRDADSAASA